MGDTTEKTDQLEDLFAEIEELLTHMQGDVSLDEAFADYEKGIGKLKLCNEQIEQIEKKMMMLNEQGNIEEF
ncbi:MAG: exodeoxyribonuclease VII small subunit [Roseburia sp.]